MCCCCCCCLGCTRDVSAAMQIGIIVLNSFSFVLILLCLIFISWDELNTASLVLFIIMLIITVIYLILSILVRYWDSNGLTKTDKKNITLGLCIFAVALCVIHFIVCIISETVVTKAFIKANFPCLDIDINTVKNIDNMDIDDCVKWGKDYKSGVISALEYVLAYLTFSYLEVALIAKGVLWIVVRMKIERNNIQVVQPVVRPSQVVTLPQTGVVMIQQPNPAFYAVQYPQTVPVMYNQPVVATPNVQGQSSNEYQLQKNPQ